MPTLCVEAMKISPHFIKKDEADKVYNAEISFYCKQFIYTQGSQPVEVRGGKDFKKSYPVHNTNIVSTIGAGDNFNAGFIFGMLKYGITRDDLLRGLTEEQWGQGYQLWLWISLQTAAKTSSIM